MATPFVEDPVELGVWIVRGSFRKVRVFKDRKAGAAGVYSYGEPPPVFLFFPCWQQAMPKPFHCAFVYQYHPTTEIDCTRVAAKRIRLKM